MSHPEQDLKVKGGSRRSAQLRFVHAEFRNTVNADHRESPALGFRTFLSGRAPAPGRNVERGP